MKMTKQRREEISKRYQELYEQDPELRVAHANRKGDIDFLNNIFLIDNLLAISAVTEEAKWNWLHRSLMHIPNQAKEWTGTPLATVKFYIDKGVTINAQDRYGMTPLHYAMRGKNAEAAIALLEAGADPNVPNRDNVIPLAMIGGMPERLDVTEMMLKKGGNIHYKNGDNELSIVNSMKKHLGNQEKFIPVIQLLEQYALK